ncbi:MAG TPA: ABC transporter ATP-binding protein [Bacteroidota bacterium]|nr:ABC transporter ATP-binding protein [Bacteroidota bacterium]
MTLLHFNIHGYCHGIKLKYFQIEPPDIFAYLESIMEAIQTQELTKQYRIGRFTKKNILALNKVSLDVHQGEIFGLLGPNGAGKTTFIKLLLSIAFPTSGSATVLGHQLGERALKEEIGYLPESHRYPSFLNAFDTLLFFGRLNGLPEQVLRERAATLLDRVGLSEWKKVKTKKFSKGMLQRLGLAQALINDPKIIFLDEPTDGVDPVGRKEIRDMLFGLKNEGKTIFLNSHLLSEVEAISDRVAILNKGEVIKVGTIEEINSQKIVYAIQLSAHLPLELEEKFKSSLPSVVLSENLLTVTLNDKSELNSVIDALRNANIAIEGMTQQKTSLEDYFIQLVKGDAQ